MNFLSKIVMTGVFAAAMLAAACGDDKYDGSGKSPVIYFQGGPSVLFTGAELQELKSAVLSAPSGSTLKSAYNHLLDRCDNALSLTTTANLSTDPFDYYNDFLDVAGYARDLSLAYRLTSRTEYATKALAILNEWSKCAAVQYPSDNTATGMLLARTTFPAICAYDMLKGTSVLDDASKQAIRQWFRSQIAPIKRSIQYWHDNDYFNKQYYQNHCAAHTMGLLAIGYALEDAATVVYGWNSGDNPRDLYELIRGCVFQEGDEPCAREGTVTVPPRKGEIYDRYRHITTEPGKGLQYSHLTLTLLTISARICTNNSIDMFVFIAPPTGENLRYAFGFYEQFYRKNNANADGSGFYTSGGRDETSRIGRVGDSHGLFELGYAHYPDYQPLKNYMAVAPGSSYNRGSADNYDQILGFYRFYSAKVDKTK